MTVQRAKENARWVGSKVKTLHFWREFVFDRAHYPQYTARFITNDMKTFLPWLFALVFLGAAGFFFSSNRKLTQEVATLKQKETQAEELRVELEHIKANGSPVQNEEIAKLRRDTEDVLKLRNEVRQLREGQKDLTAQAQKAQAQAEAARSQAVQAQQATQTAQQQALAAQQQAQAAAAAAQTQAQAAGTQGGGGQDTTAVCSRQLRQIDGATQQWALENRQPANVIPTNEQLAAYLRGGGMPRCPGGGTYTLRSVAEGPTCSIQNHVLPRPQQ